MESITRRDALFSGAAAAAAVAAGVPVMAATSSPAVESPPDYPPADELIQCHSDYKLPDDAMNPVEWMKHGVDSDHIYWEAARLANHIERIRTPNIELPLLQEMLFHDVTHICDYFQCAVTLLMQQKTFGRYAQPVPFLSVRNSTNELCKPSYYVTPRYRAGVAGKPINELAVQAIRCVVDSLTGVFTKCFTSCNDFWRDLAKDANRPYLARAVVAWGFQYTPVVVRYANLYTLSPVFWLETISTGFIATTVQRDRKQLFVDDVRAAGV